MDHEAMMSMQSLATDVILACGLLPDHRSADGSSRLRVVLTSNLFNRVDPGLSDTVETAVHQASPGGEPR